jgi:predicted dinucleotide-utilizing enzyme
MIKCHDCYAEKMEVFITSPQAAESANLTALTQSADAVIVWDGNALCEDHLLKRFLSLSSFQNFISDGNKSCTRTL